MRRRKQMLSVDECIEILNKGTSGVLALTNENSILSKGSDSIGRLLLLALNKHL